MPNDFTDHTSDVILTDGENTNFQPRDMPLENSNKPLQGSTLAGSAALDKLFGGSAPAEDKSTEEDTETETETTAPESSETPEKKADKTAPAEAPEADAKKDTADKKAETAPAKPESTEPKDKLAEVQLPPHAKPATVKSFNEVKRRAREDISRLNKELEETKAKLPKPGQALPEAVEKELKELREWRKIHDYQNDGEFKNQFVAPIEANNASILGKLKAAGWTEENIAKVKEIGVDKLDWDAVLDKLQPATRRSIEALLLDNERISEKKTQALDAAKTAPADFAAKQQKVEADRVAQESATVRNVVDSTLSQLEWFKEIPVPANATTEQKTAIDAKNAFHKEQVGRLNLLLSDGSPEMRGQMIAATLLAYQKQNEANDFKARFEKADAELKKIRKASNTRSPRNAPAPADVKTSSSVHTRGGDALDNLRNGQNND